MTSRARLLGHPLHPILVVFPLGLLATAAVFDVLFLTTRTPAFVTVSYWLIAAGLVGGAAAAIPGALDWAAIPARTRAKIVGTLHGAGNAVVLVLFLASWMVRRVALNTGADPGGAAYVLSFGGVALALVTGWLGGELVYRLGVGVDDGANLDAPNSLKGEPAGPQAAQP